ncbi:hypothetical protein [Mesorhizobium sp. CN2-181]|uniref:hypothetical protein n=1 Tax=Mesorhizobium yinganensis TaxID=3157707 RepID=UPI0032B76ECB
MNERSRVEGSEWQALMMKASSPENRTGNSTFPNGVDFAYRAADPLKGQFAASPPAGQLHKAKDRFMSPAIVETPLKDIACTVSSIHYDIPITYSKCDDF